MTPIAGADGEENDLMCDGCRGAMTVVKCCGTGVDAFGDDDSADEVCGRMIGRVNADCGGIIDDGVVNGIDCEPPPSGLGGISAEPTCIVADNADIDKLLTSPSLI